MSRAARYAWLLVLSGCAVGPNFQRPAQPSATRYTAGTDPDRTVEAGGTAQHFSPGVDVAGDWWRMFKSENLSAVVRRALDNNVGLRAARASLRRSQADRRAGYGAFFPQLDAQPSASYQRLSPLRFGQNFPPSEFALYSLSGTVSYTIDIWGGQRRQVEALGAQVDAQRSTLISAYVMLCGNVVDTLIARAGYRAQYEATRSTVELETKQLHITEAQATAGAVPYSNVLAIKTQMAATAALLPALEQHADEADHLLATLVGEAPSAWHTPGVELDQLTLPSDVPVSLPAQLVRQRADVLIAEATLHAANAQIGVATAAMLPNLTLSADGGVNSLTLPHLFAANSLFGSVAGGLTAPLFHGGTLYNQRQSAIAARDEAAANYRQTALSAFQQVADLLRGLEHDAQTLKTQQEALDAADQSLQLVQANYVAGTANYLQVVIANEQYIQAKIAQIQAVVQRLQDTVALYVAIGGGWWHQPRSVSPRDDAVSRR